MKMTEPSALSLPDDVRLLNLSEDSLSTPLKKPQAGGVGNTRSSYCYGSITSQYATIPSSASTLVEVASLYAQVRAFSQCQAAFESIDPHLRSHPVVAYEQFLAYWAQWRLLDSAKTLEDALTQAQERGANTHEYGVYTLLRISLGKAEVFTKGNFTRARDSMREVRSWLRDVLFDTYTDVQIACLNHYYFLILAANHVTDNFDHQSFRNIPFVPDKEEEELSLTRLRMAMQAQGRLRDARLILNVEMGFISDEDTKQQSCWSLIEACRHPGAKEPVWSIESIARSTLAQSYRRAGNASAAQEETDRALALLEQAPVSTEQNKAHLSVRLDQLKVTTYPDCQESFRVWTDFSGEEEVESDSCILSWALGKIADAALEILQASPSAENKAMFWRCQRRNEALLQVSGDAYFLYMSKLFTGQSALSLFDEFGPIFRWHEEFQAQYPHFRLWTLLIVGKRSLALLYTRLEQTEQVVITFAEMSEMMRQRDSFWTEGDGNKYSPQGIGNLDPIAKSSDASKAMPAFKAENLREEWFSEWINTGHVGLGRNVRDVSIVLGPQLARGSDPYMITLLRWLRIAMADSELTKTELECILAVSESEQKMKESDLATVIQELTPGTLKARLYGVDSSPTSSEMWQNMFEIFQDWLLHRAKHNETKRQYLLVKLQNERLDSLVSTYLHADMLHEAERILDLVPILGEEAQQQFRGSTINWRNVACLAKKTMLAQQDQQTLWNEELPEFREILEMYKVSLKECRESGNLTNEAATLLNIAQHYFHGALLLRPAALAAFIEYLDNADTVYQKSRESWKVLKGWAKVEKLLSAVQEELRLLLAPLAATVICQFPDENHRARALWTLIQMAKSNGLGWLMRTNDPVRSQQTEDSSRLDVDFVELPALTPEDLQQISDDVGGGVTYVDWYDGSLPGREMPNPLLLSLTSGELVKAVTVEMTWKKIKVAIDDFSFKEEVLRTEYASQVLHKLNPLVEPLATITKPGQTLVFSSIGSLHRLPLHALMIDGEPLIKRNPVVYCSSLTALHVAFKARRSTEQKRASDNTPFQASLFGDPPSQLGKKALTSLSKKFSTEAQTGDALTSSNFAAAMVNPSLSLLHYHGHVTFQEGDPKDHGLELDDRRFTLRDVFDLAPLPNSYHATLLGCGSGMSRTTVSNDVLGLVPAFLYSGAASTVSTLWPFDDADAAMYTRCFYEDFHRILGSGQEGVVDLAKANQKAVLAIREKRPALYHWAPFVVNGYWMYRLPGS